jgi:hypothetical protein
MCAGSGPRTRSTILPTTTPWRPPTDSDGLQSCPGEAIFNLPLVWLGVRPEVVGATLLFSLLYQFWLHTELVPRLGWLEWVLNTPSHHRVHHASNPEYLDRNFGGTLIVFDRLFGTFVAQRPDLPCRYGLVKRLVSYNPGFIAVHEWLAMARDVRRANSWWERLGYVLGPPGWSPVKAEASPIPPPPPSAECAIGPAKPATMPV